MIVGIARRGDSSRIAAITEVIQVPYNTFFLFCCFAYLPADVHREGWSRRVTLTRLIRKAGFKRTVDAAFLSRVQVTFDTPHGIAQKLDNLA